MLGRGSPKIWVQLLTLHVKSSLHQTTTSNCNQLKTDQWKTQNTISAPKTFCLMVPKPFCSYSSVNGKPMRRGYTATCMWGESISLQAWIVVDKWKEIYQDLAWIDKEDFLQTYQVFESFSAFRVSLQLDTIKTMCYSVYDVTARLNTVVSSSAESRNYFPEQTGTLKAAQIKSCRIAPIASDSMLMWRIPVHRSQCGVYRSLCLMKKKGL